MFHTYIAHLITKSKDQLKEISFVKSFDTRSQPNQMPDWIKIAKQRSLMGKIAFPLWILIVQLIIWSVAMIEYLKPAKNYI